MVEGLTGVKGGQGGLRGGEQCGWWWAGLQVGGGCTASGGRGQKGLEVSFLVPATSVMYSMYEGICFHGCGCGDVSSGDAVSYAIPYQCPLRSDTDFDGFGQRADEGEIGDRRVGRPVYQKDRGCEERESWNRCSVQYRVQLSDLIDLRVAHQTQLSFHCTVQYLPVAISFSPRKQPLEVYF